MPTHFAKDRRVDQENAVPFLRKLLLAIQAMDRLKLIRVDSKGAKQAEKVIADADL